jgi:GAF domain-containing protein
MKIAEVLGNLAVEMRAQADSESILRAIVTAATDIVPGISWAGVALVRGRSVVSSTPTDAVAETLGQLQSDLGEGPVFDALSQQHTVILPDLAAETRWPRFVEASVGRGVHCMAAFRLFVEQEALGALILYGPAPNMFDEDSVLYGEILAQHAAVAMAGARAEEQLQQAIASRDIIGQAKGILMQRDKVSALQAFATLARASQDTNIKLVDVARFLVSEFENELAAKQ